MIMDAKSRGVRPQLRGLLKNSRQARWVRCQAVAYPQGPPLSAVHSILDAVAQGRVDVDDAARNLEEISSGLHALQAPTPQVVVLDASAMSAPQLAQELADAAHHQHKVAARCVTAETYAAVRSLLKGVQYHAGANMLLYQDTDRATPAPVRLPGRVAIFCGSGADMRIAFETKIALELAGAYASLIRGVSANDLVSVVRAKQRAEGADVLVVCCAEQPALAGMLSGIVDAPVLAVPGEGVTDPTLALPSSGVMKVAPGDGISAAAAAARMLRLAAQYIQHRKDRESPRHTPELENTMLSGLDRNDEQRSRAGPTLSELAGYGSSGAVPLDMAPGGTTVVRAGVTLGRVGVGSS